MKKRPFILLEILLACTFLSLCAAPLMRAPLQFYRIQMAALKEVEKQRLADLSFAEMKVHLLKNEIPWKKLPCKKTRRRVYALPAALVQIPHCEPTPIQRKALLTCRGEKTGIKGEIIRLLEIEILFEPFQQDAKEKKTDRFIYKTIVKKKP